ncbi:uncharacterized protein M8220_016892 [Acridotheres tristis]
MELRELSPSLLESLVAVVATLGDLAATVAGTDGDVLLAVSPKSLCKALEIFIDHLSATLGHEGDTSLGQYDVPSLGETLAALGDTPGPTWDHVTTAASTWQASVATLRDSWTQRAREATELRDACRDAATTEATATATATARAGDLQDKATHCTKTGDDLVATIWRLPVATDKEEGASTLEAYKAKVGDAAEEARVAIKGLESSLVAVSEAKAAIKRRQRAEAALGPLEHLVATCDKATAMVQELWRQVRDIKATLVATKEAFPDVPKALVAKVAEAERLWEASADLAMCHLQGTLGNILKLLPSGPGGPGSCTVAEQCQKAIEDIPRLLQGE